MLDELCTAGEVVWVGAGAIGSRDGRIRLCFADQLPLLAPGWETLDAPSGPLHDAIRGLLADRGASFWGAIREAAPDSTDAEVLIALWDLVWAGEVTNDSLAPLRAVIGGAAAKPGAASRRHDHGAPRPGRLVRIGPPAGAGRWSLVAPLREPVPTPTEAAHASALQLIERYGVVTREAVLAEGVAGGFRQRVRRAEGGALGERRVQPGDGDPWRRSEVTKDEVVLAQKGLARATNHYDDEKYGDPLISPQPLDLWSRSTRDGQSNFITHGTNSLQNTNHFHYV